MRILMTADTVGGVLSYALDLCGALSRAGGEVLLLTLGPRQGHAPGSLAAELPGVRWVHDDSKLEWMDDADDDVARSGELLLALEREFRPDLIHLNGYAHAALPFRAPTLVVGHSCVLSWWRAVWGAPAPAKYDAYRSRVQQGLRAASVVVAPSEAMLRALRENYVSDLAGLVIHNGAAHAGSAGSLSRAGACSAGRLWDPAKNFDLLLRAAQGSSWTFRIAGPDVAPGAGQIARAPGSALPANVRLTSDSWVAWRARSWRCSSRAALSMSTPRAMSRSVCACSRPRKRAARWYSPTSPVCVSCGMAQLHSCPRTTSVP
jgi:hypothetical protein